MGCLKTGSFELQNQCAGDELAGGWVRFPCTSAIFLWYQRFPIDLRLGNRCVRYENCVAIWVDCAWIVLESLFLSEVVISFLCRCSQLQPHEKNNSTSVDEKDYKRIVGLVTDILRSSVLQLWHTVDVVSRPCNV